MLKRCRHDLDAYGSEGSKPTPVLQEMKYPGSVVSDPGGPGGGVSVQHKGVVCVIGDRAMLVQRRGEKGKEFLFKAF